MIKLKHGNKKKEAEGQEGEMSLLDHLGELRKRLIIILACFALTSMLSFNYVNLFVAKLLSLASGYNFVYISPAELVMQNMKMSIIIGIILSSPVLIFELWKFIMPGLKKNEKRAVLFALISGVAFFLLGAAFAYFIMIPMMLIFFKSFIGPLEIAPMITIKNYLDFIIGILITFGLIFEMPVLAMLLSQIGILKPELLVKNRKIIIVLIFVAAAIITPSTDIFSQILAAVPIIMLFEISVLLCKLITRRKAKKLDLVSE